ncbi:3'5'-cyclic nucleotide phosphodiesterase domain-containing protein [Cardiosporidium cionae]|uniref:3'5'-cyclic nucleotide phosphodiesterase domain-containing protein n=1 Tax=Cardiosporidium cionae TaxID=476202 RepID=A0ABQ7J6J7_9APIC|nr:3'5'-cyclic nucleotide phosphodiesterase domain-containing protein [Cardiosporidium cionae]|eukprot:KAF8819613.1 3'5'-cyclic nucleotide phosphodiesterase domain-containing protein [Cardiosporidium cionae]
MEDRRFLTEILIHCADISNPVMNSGLNVKWASLITQEFNCQVEMEKRYNMPLSTFMDTRTEIDRTKAQIGFLQFVVLDQFRALARIFPLASELVERGEKNLQNWRKALKVLSDYENARRENKHVDENLMPHNFTFRLKHLLFDGFSGPKCFGHINGELRLLLHAKNYTKVFE